MLLTHNDAASVMINSLSLSAKSARHYDRATTPKLTIISSHRYRRLRYDDTFWFASFIATLIDLDSRPVRLLFCHSVSLQFFKILLGQFLLE